MLFSPCAPLAGTAPRFLTFQHLPTHTLHVFVVAKIFSAACSIKNTLWWAKGIVVLSDAVKNASRNARKRVRLSVGEPTPPDMPIGPIPIAPPTPLQLGAAVTPVIDGGLTPVISPAETPPTSHFDELPETQTDMHCASSPVAKTFTDVD